MELTGLFFLLGGISLPVGIYFWRENRYRNPAVRWSQLAELLEFKYVANPPRLVGQWKGRNLELRAREADAYLILPVNTNGSVRVEIGPREEVERAAGIVVPDRVRFSGGPLDSKFEERYLVRATPLELGEDIDPALRQRLLNMDDVTLLATSGRIEMRMSIPTEASQIREVMDVAVSVAEIVDRT